jgi:hypothetical protein
MRQCLSPLPGLLLLWFVYPRLTPWAAFFRRFAASPILMVEAIYVCDIRHITSSCDPFVIQGLRAEC